MPVDLIGFSNSKFNLCRMAIKAVLFDMIGTTVLEDDPEMINRCFENAFLANSVSVTKSQILNVRGKDKLEAIDQILSSTGSSSDLQSKIFASFHESLSSQISNFREDKELKEVISFLRSKNILIGVGSGLPSSIFQLVFDHLAWQKYRFDYSAVFEKFSAGRPQPFMIFDMCSQLNLEASQILKVGDTVSDIHEGKNAGAPTGVILSGTQPEQMIREAQPDYILKTLADVMSILS